MVDKIKNDGLDNTAVTSLDVTTVANDDQLLVSDTSDSGNLKRISISDLPSGGGGSVDSVNGQTGIVVLDTDDISEGATNLYFQEAPNDGNQYARANESWQQVDAGVTSIIAGSNITISPVNGVGDVTINATGGGGGAVDSVNGQTGVVVLDTDDIAEGATNLYFTEAPNDGNQYARQNEGWQQVISGTFSDAGTLTKTFSSGEEYILSLSRNISVAPYVAATREVNQIGVTNNEWKTAISESEFNLETGLQVGTSGIEIDLTGGTFVGDYLVGHTADSGQIDVTYWTDINSMTSDDNANGEFISYALSDDGRETFYVLSGGLGKRNIVRNNGGVWEVNSAVDYLSETWQPSVVNTLLSALGEAQELVIVGFDLNGASYDNVSFSVSGQDNSPRGLAFSADGLKMFVVGFTNDIVYQYNLPSAFELTGATYDNVSFSVSGQEGGPTGLSFSSDGLKMFVVGVDSDSVHQYTLLSPFDLNGATYDSVSFSVTGQETTPYGLSFSSDGLKMFVVGSVSDSVHQYTLLSPFDLNGATYDSVSFSVAGQETNPRAMAFSADGLKMFVVGFANDIVYQYNLPSAFELTGATYDNVSFSVSGQEGGPAGLSFSSDGLKMFVVGVDSDSVHQYSLSPSLQNAMPPTQLASATDADFPEVTTTLDLAVILRTDTTGTTPTSNGASINYDGEVAGQGAILGTDYNYQLLDPDRVRISIIVPGNYKFAFG